MKKFLKMTAVFSIVGCFVFAGVAMAATTANQTVSFNNGSTLDVSVSSASVNLGAADPATPSTDSSTTLTVKSNAGYSLTTQASGDFSDGATGSIPVARMTTNLGDAQLGAVALSTTPQPIYNDNTTGTTEAGDALTIGYSLDLEYGDDTGSGFSTTVTYTASN